MSPSQYYEELILKENQRKFSGVDYWMYDRRHLFPNHPINHHRRPNTTKKEARYGNQATWGGRGSCTSESYAVPSLGTEADGVGKIGFCGNGRGCA